MPEADKPRVISYRGYIFGKEVSRGFWEKQVWSEEDKDKLIYGTTDLSNYDREKYVIDELNGQALTQPDTSKSE